jgi:hypothetical protein
MKKSILFLLTSFVLLLADFAALAQSPSITSPSNGATVTPCGFNVTVSAINPPPSDGRFYRVRVQYKRSDQGTPAYTSNTVFEPLDGSDADFGPYTVFIPASGVLQNNTVYNIRSAYQVFDEDTEQWILYGTNSPVINVTTSTINSNPVFTSPTDGATGVSITPTINLAAYTGCGNLAVATIEIDKETSFTNPDYQNTFVSNSNGPFSWTVPSELNYGTVYYARARFFTNSGLVGSTTISFTTQAIVPTDPLLNSPITQYNNRLDICSSNVTLNVNANNVAARSLLVKVTQGATTVFQQTYNFTNSTQATTAFDVNIPSSNFTNNGDYLVELLTRDATAGFIAQLYYDLFIGTDKTAPALNTPVITSPADGATVSSFTPVIQIQSPFQGCTLNSVTYEILDGTVGSTVVASQTYTTPTYNWTVSTFLTAGNTYRARVTYNTANGTFTDVNQFTVSPTPGVTISSPLSLTGLDPCGFPVTVAAYPDATTVRVEYKLASSGTYITFYSTPVIASTAMSFSFDNTQLQANQTYDLRLTAGTGTNGTFAALSSPTSFSFSTTGVGGILDPTLASPTNGATGVSLTPTITFGSYQGNCGSVGNYQIEIVPVGGAGDWNTRAGYYSVNSATPSIVIPNGILAQSTTYKIRITVRIDLNGGTVGFYNNYDGNDSSPDIYTFTTIGPTLPSTLITNIADDTYLNSFSQSFVANAVTGATSYEWQFSTDASFTSALITKTSTTPTLNFQANEAGFVAGQQYFVRVRGISASAQGVFSTDPAEVTSYYHPLFGAFITSPTVENLTERRFGLKGLAIPNINAYYFQMAIANPANDSNPAADFTAGNIFNNSLPYYQAVSYPGLSSSGTVQQIPSVTGNVFLANNIKTFAWGTELIVNYIQAQPQTRYRVRALPVRVVNGQIVQQMDLSNVPITTFGTNGIPNRSHAILSPANGQTSVNNTESTNLTRITVQGLALQWDITNYQIQVSTSSDFTSGVISQPNDATFTGTGTVGGVTEGNPVFLVPNLAFNTIYYVRARSTAVVNGSPAISAWGPVTQFTTKATAAGRVGAQGAAMDDISTSYPNPFEQTIKVQVSASHGKAVIYVRDLTGRLIEKRQENGGAMLQIGESYGKGMYIITIESPDKIETLKIIKR